MAHYYVKSKILPQHLKCHYVILVLSNMKECCRFGVDSISFEVENHRKSLTQNDYICSHFVLARES